MKWGVKTNIFLTYFLPKNMSRRGKGGRFFNRRDDSLRDFERHYSSRDEGSNGNRGNYDGSEAGSSFMGQGRGRGRGGRGGHPSGLKGKDIGMWYRQKSLQNKKKEEEKFDLRLAVNLDPRRHQQIEDLLCSIRTPYLCGAQKKISKSNIFSDTLRTKGEFVKKSGTKESERLDKFSGERSNNTKVPDNWDDVMEDSEACKPNLSSVSVPGASENWETTSIKYSHIGESEFKRKFLQNITGSIGSKMDNSLFMTSVLANDSKLDESLKERLLAKQENSARYNQMLEFRKKLPSFQMRQDILHMVRENQVILISGETGCGKTTQVAQFILDDYILRGEGSTCHVVCTQPRRISATSVAERVASERDEVCGADSTGYQIRLEAKICRKKGSILFCTTGILLQWMRSDPALREVSHLVLDEIHERDVTSDFVITILKDVIPKRPNLKVILMSATLNAEQFSKYYDNCPSINIPGFTYPVEELYLEDVLHLTNFTAFKPPRQEQGWKKHMPQNKSKLRKVDEFKDFIEPYVRHLQSQKKYSSRVLECLKNPNSEDICLELVEALLHHICSTKEDGAILVFLPGWADISSLHNIITNSGRYPLSRYTVIPLHSMMPTTTQKSVFDRPPRGVRKIVLATNIAETSITIDDVVYVVDCGKIKMKNFDVENNIATLKSEWVSLANARQRKGRAGRVQPGVCYHLYTRAREMTLENYPLPEMLRSRLEEVILQLKILQLGQAEPFLQRVMDPPDPRVLEISLKLLHTLNALDSDENLTPLGYHLANLPLDPQTGKMILMGAMFSCIDPIFSVAASLTFKDPFVIPLGKEDQVNKCKIELSNGSKSDHLVIAEAVKLWEQAKTHGHSRDFCWDYFLSQNTLNLLKDMKEQFARYLYDMNFLSEQDVKAPTSNVNSNNLSLVKAIICAGLYPNIAIIKSVKRRNHTGKVIIKLSTPEDGRVELHPKSINEKMSDFESRFLLYHLKLKSTAIFLHDTTMVYPLPLLFFGEGVDYYEENGTEFIAVNNSIRFKCRKSTSSLVKDLRNRLDGLLEHKVTHPGVIDWSRTSEEGALLRAIIELITYEDKQLMIAQEVDDDNFSN